MSARILHGDCREVMATLDASSIDAIVTDPPYGLAFMGKGWDHAVPGVEFWTEALRVAKPGAHLVAFGGTRTYHRLTCAIEDAGFEIRDCLSWLYGSGFPKSHNGPWGGTVLKPAWEPIILARKPLAGTVLANLAAHGTGALNIDGCRIGTTVETWPSSRARPLNPRDSYFDYTGSETRTVSTGEVPAGRWPANVALDEAAAAMLDQQSGVSVSKAGGKSGSNANPMSWDENNNNRPRGGHTDVGGASRFFFCAKASRSERDAGLDGMPRKAGGIKNDSGRGFSESDPYREIHTTNHHPTVKPLALMRWLCRLVTPPGGTVLDPFAGSGSTGCAAVAEGFHFIGIEREAEYVEIARRRIDHWQDDQLGLFGGAK